MLKLQVAHVVVQVKIKNAPRDWPKVVFASRIQFFRLVLRKFVWLTVFRTCFLEIFKKEKILFWKILKRGLQIPKNHFHKKLLIYKNNECFFSQNNF